MMVINYKEVDSTGAEVTQTAGQQGSGVVVAHINGGQDGGYVVTNWHILKNAHLKEEDYKNVVLR